MPSLLARATGYKAGRPSSLPNRRLLQKSTVSLDAQNTNQVGGGPCVRPYFVWWSFCDQAFGYYVSGCCEIEPIRQLTQ